MTRRRHCDSKREEIVRAAIQLFAQQGVDGTTIREIGRQAGVSEAALYKHFPSKDAVALAVTAHYSSVALRLIETHARAEGPFAARLDALVASIVQFHDAEPLGMLLLEQRSRALMQMARPPRTPLDAMAEFIQAGIDAGELPPQDARISAALFLGAANRLAAFTTSGSLPAQLVPSIASIQTRMRGLLGVR